MPHQVTATEFYRWLNLLLIITLLNSIILPVYPAQAAVPQQEPAKIDMPVLVGNLQTLPWYYPAAYLGTDNIETVQYGAASGRPYDLTVTNPEYLTSGSESGATELVGYVPGPNLGGWDLDDNERCIGYDFNVSLNLTAGASPNVEAQLSRIDVSSAGFGFTTLNSNILAASLGKRMKMVRLRAPMLPGIMCGLPGFV